MPNENDNDKWFTDFMEEQGEWMIALILFIGVLYCYL